ncbi:MAG: RNA 2',3'-cyclic phosphodiesterase [Deferribacteres bacterium]|nr:RNA 2',3'-cyclic phosphodiesterase [candidate division KSB1 bacterium]MCB9502958.1 RNA 2',3'-cyclic phosphodiesterase [Deferribacteres bacterium]
MAGSEQTQRLFFCFDLPTSAKEIIAEYQAELKKYGQGVAWTRIENTHLTLKFLGDTKVATVDKIGEVMGKIAQETSIIELAFDKVGAFPSMKSPKVLWIGCSNVPDEIKILHKRLTRDLRSLGFESENREYTPHLTLGRVKLGNVDKIIEKMKESTAPVFSFRAHELILMKSELKRTGPVYTEIKNSALNN